MKYLTDDELDVLIVEYDTDAPQDGILWYALVELKTHRIIRSMSGKKAPRGAKRHDPGGK